MPLPKRRHSNQRTRKRRTHYKLTPPEVVQGYCPGCQKQNFRLDHHACPDCGFYNGKQAIAVKETATAEE